MEYTGGFINFGKKFDSVNWEALRFKMKEIGVSENFVFCVKRVHHDIRTLCEVPKEPGKQLCPVYKTGMCLECLLI
jgi:hypothetical protein